MGIIGEISLLIITVLFLIISKVNESNIWLIFAGISGFITIVYGYIGLIIMVTAK